MDEQALNAKNTLRAMTTPNRSWAINVNTLLMALMITTTLMEINNVFMCRVTNNITWAYKDIRTKKGDILEVKIITLNLTKLSMKITWYLRLILQTLQSGHHSKTSL